MCKRNTSKSSVECKDRCSVEDLIPLFIMIAKLPMFSESQYTITSAGCPFPKSVRSAYSSGSSSSAINREWR